MIGWLEWLGYLGSALIAVSLMMRNIVRLRWINLAGASTFAVYGLLIGSYPVFVLDAFIAAVDIYYLIEMYTRRDYFTLLPVLNSSKFLEKFLEYHQSDIAHFFPEFDWKALSEPNCLFILRNMVPVGLFIYEKRSESEIDVRLDFAIPDYRDLKNAHFIYFAQSRFFSEAGYTTLFAESSVPAHQKYLRNMGFKTLAGNPRLFSKKV